MATNPASLTQAVFEEILAIASDAIVCVDAGQTIIFFNCGAEKIFGYAAEEILGEPLEVLLPDPQRATHRTHIQEFGRSVVPARRMGERGEIMGRKKSGEIFPAEASISQLNLDDGSQVFTAVVRDVTERKLADEEMTAKTRELERSNADLQEFAYVASHDLQEPLRMVASYTQLLQRRYGGQLDETADEFIGYAVDGVQRMHALINDLLSYSRVGTEGRAFRNVDLEEVVGRVLKTLAPAIRETGAEVTLGDMPNVWGDDIQLAQLLQNLIGNAIKFHGDERPRVHIGAEKKDDRWVVSIRDEGIGLDPKFQQRIFVIFQRLHSRSEYPGTGIGLSICRKIVERHGGEIRVESAVGEGATFSFSLPGEQ